MKKKTTLYIVIGIVVVAVAAHLLLRPRIAQNSYEKGIVLLDSLQYGQAYEQLNRAVRFSPKNPDYLFGRGMALAGLNRDSAAIADYTKAIAIDSMNFDYFLNRGVSLRKIGNCLIA